MNRLVTNVTVFPAFDPALPLDPDLPRITTTALWDTGATKSVISPVVASTLSLSPVGTVNVAHAGGVGQSPTYVVNLTLPNRVGINGILVYQFPGGGGFEMLIGMDIISHGDLSVTNVGGKTCMSFRMPSVAEHDFVKEWNQKRYAGVGRNDPCPCGTKDTNGKVKKFKDCHQPKARR